jgi:hypothetical protein
LVTSSVVAVPVTVKSPSISTVPVPCGSNTILLAPVEIIACVCTSKSPPSCGVVSSTILKIPVSVSMSAPASHCEVDVLYFNTSPSDGVPILTSPKSPMLKGDKSLFIHALPLYLKI